MQDLLLELGLDGVQMYVNFEIAAIFSSSHRRVKKRGNFKTNIAAHSIELFLYCLSSSAIKHLAGKFRLDWIFQLFKNFFHINSCKNVDKQSVDVQILK